MVKKMVATTMTVILSLFFGCGESENSDDTELQSIRVSAKKRFPKNSDRAEQWIKSQVAAEKLFQSMKLQYAANPQYLKILEKAAEEYPEDRSARTDRAKEMFQAYENLMSFKSSDYLTDKEFEFIKELSLKNNNGDILKANSYAILVFDSIRRVKTMEFNNLSAEDIKKSMEIYAKRFAENPIGAAEKLEADVYARGRFLSREIPAEYEGIREYIEKKSDDFAIQLSMLETVLVEGNKTLPPSLEDGYAPESQWNNPSKNLDDICKLVVENSVYFADSPNGEIPCLYFFDGKKNVFLTELDIALENPNSIILHKNGERVECKFVGTVGKLPLAVVEPMTSPKGKPVSPQRKLDSAKKLNLCGVNAFGVLASKRANISRSDGNHILFHPTENTQLMKAGTFAIGVDTPKIVAIKVKSNRAANSVPTQWNLEKVNKLFLSSETSFPEIGEKAVEIAKKYAGETDSGIHMTFVNASALYDIDYVSDKLLADAAKKIDTISKHSFLLLKIFSENKFSSFLNDEVRQIWPELSDIAKERDAVFLSGPKTTTANFVRAYKYFIYSVAKLAEDELKVISKTDIPDILKIRYEAETAMRYKIIYAMKKISEDNFRSFKEYCPSDLFGNVDGKIYNPKKS